MSVGPAPLPGPPLPRAIVVDDDGDAAASLAALLRDMGCEAAAYTDGLRAIDAAVHSAPQLVVIDLNMRGLDGCETLREGRRRGALDHALCVCLSGNHEPAEKRRCLDEGFSMFLNKPVDIDVLAEIVAQLRRAAH